MKLTTKGRYAVAALADIAANGGAEPVALPDVARRQGISAGYLEQLFAKLLKVFQQAILSSFLRSFAAPVLSRALAALRAGICSLVLLPQSGSPKSLRPSMRRFGQRAARRGRQSVARVNRRDASLMTSGTSWGATSNSFSMRYRLRMS